MAPCAPTMASLGLTTIEGSGSGGRRPGLSSRVKQSCRLLNSAFLASDRSRSLNIRQHAIEASRTSGFSILLNQPMNRVSAARGMRLVKRKFRSSCCVRAEIRPRTVMILLDGPASAGGMDSSLPILSLSTAALEFTETYRVPFQYSRLGREHLGAGAVVQSSAGVSGRHLVGRIAYDL